MKEIIKKINSRIDKKLFRYGSFPGIKHGINVSDVKNIIREVLLSSNK